MEGERGKEKKISCFFFAFFFKRDTEANRRKRGEAKSKGDRIDI